MTESDRLNDDGFPPLIVGSTPRGIPRPKIVGAGPCARPRKPTPQPPTPIRTAP